MSEDSYRNVESEVEHNLVSKVILFASPSVAKLVNDSRQFANRLKYSDEEILSIAQNRMRFHQAHKNDLSKKLSAFFHRIIGKEVSSASFRVTGEELRVLASIAGLKVDEDIEATHEYEVNPDYYGVLVDLAVKVNKSG
jgi:hypothetical protein